MMVIDHHAVVLEAIAKTDTQAEPLASKGPSKRINSWTSPAFKVTFLQTIRGFLLARPENQLVENVYPWLTPLLNLVPA
jgi:hypothetical protein